MRRCLPYVVLTALFTGKKYCKANVKVANILSCHATLLHSSKLSKLEHWHEHNGRLYNKCEKVGKIN